MKINILLSTRIALNGGCVRIKKNVCSVNRHQHYSSFKKKRERKNERETKERNLMMLLVGRQVKSNTFVTATIRNVDASFYCTFFHLLSLSLLFYHLIVVRWRLTFYLCTHVLSFKCVLSNINLVDERTIIGHWIFLIDITDFQQVKKKREREESIDVSCCCYYYSYFYNILL